MYICSSVWQCHWVVQLKLCGFATSCLIDPWFALLAAWLSADICSRCCLLSLWFYFAAMSLCCQQKFSRFTERFLQMNDVSNPKIWGHAPPKQSPLVRQPIWRQTLNSSGFCKFLGYRSKSSTKRENPDNQQKLSKVCIEISCRKNVKIWFKYTYIYT